MCSYFGFNPYYHGTTSRSSIGIDVQKKYLAVSILIITELHLEAHKISHWGLHLDRFNPYYHGTTSRSLKNESSRKMGECFNPYYHGTTSRRLNDKQEAFCQEYGFNPYYHGTTSRSTTIYHLPVRLHPVSILIITELHLEVHLNDFDNTITIVSILIITELHLEAISAMTLSKMLMGFNPYYHGTTSRRN